MSSSMQLAVSLGRRRSNPRCDTAELEPASPVATLKQILAAPFSFSYPMQSIFIFTFWGGDPGQFHCVRLAGIDSTHVYLMNPKVGNALDKVERATFDNWGKMLMLVEKK